MLAGTACLDITPEGSVWMDGMIRSHTSEGVHDRLYTRALVLGETAEPAALVALVSVDVCALSEEATTAIRQAAQASTGIPAARMIIACTHTHSGPAARGYFNPCETVYLQVLIGLVAEAICQAAAALRPALAGCASGAETTISHYRRLLAADGHVVMNWEPYPADQLVGPLGEVDPEVGVLRVVEAAHPERVICLLCNHAGHPNVLSGENYLLSADYPGLAMRLLEARYGGTAIFINGAQGTMDIDGLRDRDWEGMARVGQALAAAVAETAEGITPADLPIRHARVQYTVPARQITTEEWAWAQRMLVETGGIVQPQADGVGDDYLAVLYRTLRDKQDRPIPFEQVCIAIGDTAWLSVPCELYTEIGMAIKAASPFRRTYILGLANGNIGYVPTRKAIGEGGYAEDTRTVDAAAEEIILRHSLAVLTQVYDACMPAPSPPSPR